MPMNLSNFFNDAGNYIVKEDSFFNSPFKTSLVVIGIILIIVYLTVSEETELKYEDGSFFKILAKVGAWGFVSTLVIQYIHYTAVNKFCKKNQVATAQEEIANAPVSGTNTIAPFSNLDNKALAAVMTAETVASV